ncbi:MAG TPA: hypothetical protein PL078_03915 [Bacillota bacterium]|nr:hypothetical protein [Peptococcaceae bacterium MAG4]NLW39101.1 hypothetical protein [Peptococcaceae bacterium]HPU35552.1 hypothetical protein [Bacillota bacterium]HPZ43132.1 hypothetical protein [Bacillota bacterium]HQD75870.1 hypothetical protein [Bacillota bacterium]
MYKRHSPVLTCGCCSYRGTMKFLVNYCERDLETVKSPCGYLVHDILQPWGVAYELLQCPSCGTVLLIKIEWHDAWEPEDYIVTVLYPNCPGS